MAANALPTIPPDIMVVSAKTYQDLMGCDIHIILQFRKESDIWDNINAGYMGRDYTLFGYIAGVRGGAEPIVSPRGLPDDFSDWEKEELRGEHSFTWLSPQEMQKVINLYLLEPENGDCMKLRYINLLALRLEKDGYEVRFVIGFDS